MPGALFQSHTDRKGWTKMRKHIIKIDQLSHMDALEAKKPDQKARERFRRPAYQAAQMVRAQGKQMEHKSVAEYVAEKYGIGDDGSERDLEC